MAFTYTYTVATDFTGGYFNSDVSNRLLALIAQQIALPVVINSTGANVTVEFEQQLSAPNKTILDGDTSNPAGGLIARSTEHFEVIVGGNVIGLGGLLGQVANGILSTAVTLQMKNGLGNNISGANQDPVNIDPAALAPLTATSGNFNAVTGAFSLTVGPSFSRGKVELVVNSGSLPSRDFSVEFA